MRILKVAFLVLLVQAIAGTGIMNAAQESHAQTVPHTGEAYLQREVGHVLTGVPWYTVFDILQYSVSGNDVTLSGAVVKPTVKTDAENAVKNIEGVEKVNDQIEVLPVSQMDDQIRRAEYRAIYSQDLLSRYGVGALQSIHIIVKDGHVTLEGQVDSQADKDAATLYAKTVPNVFSVANDLVVTGSK